MAALVPARVEHHLGTEILVLSPAVVARVEAARTLLASITITDADTLKAKDAAFKSLRDLRAEIEEERLKVKRPVLALASAIDEAAKPALAAIDGDVAAGKTAIEVWNAAERKRHAEAVAKAEADAREKQRLADVAAKEAADKAAAELAEKRKADQAERERQAKVDAELAELMGTAPAEPEPAPPAPIIAPTAPPPVQRTIVAPAAVAAPTLSKAVTSRTEKRAHLADPALIPHQVTAADGTVYVLREYRTAEITRALKAGCAVPGCELRDTTNPTSIGA